MAEVIYKTNVTLGEFSLTFEISKKIFSFNKIHVCILTISYKIKVD